MSAALNETLYSRLGGRTGIEAIASDIFDNHVKNPVVQKRYVNSNPQEVKRLVTEMCCAGFGGPEEYTGKDMISAHTGMNINNDEFIAVVDDVMSALDMNNVAQPEKDEILVILYSMKPEIVHL